METDPESFYDSATNIEKSINISEIPTHIHIDHNNEDVWEGNTFNVTVLLCSDETSHEHLVGELIHYKITNMDQTVTIDEGNFISIGDGYNITIENLPEQGYKVLHGLMEVICMINQQRKQRSFQIIMVLKLK